MTEHSQDEDFARAMADVAPLKGVPRHASSGRRSKSTSEIAQGHRRAAAEGRESQVDANPLTLGEVPAIEPAAVIEWKQDGVQQAVFNKLRNGQYEASAALDLHGLTVKEARVALYGFLLKARSRDARSVLIAHGRGEKSATPARLKSYVAHWLAELPEVIAFHSALSRQGGTGAVYVLLKKSKRQKEETRERHGLQTEFEDEAERR